MRIKVRPDASAPVSISTALGTRSDRRTSGRRQQSPNSAPGHQYFLRSSAKMKSPTVSASSETPHTPLPKRYKPLELAKMSVEARMALREEKIIPKENASARDIAEAVASIENSLAKISRLFNPRYTSGVSFEDVRGSIWVCPGCNHAMLKHFAPRHVCKPSTPGV